MCFPYPQRQVQVKGRLTGQHIWSRTGESLKTTPQIKKVLLLFILKHTNKCKRRTSQYIYIYMKIIKYNILKMITVLSQGVIQFTMVRCIPDLPNNRILSSQLIWKISNIFKKNFNYIYWHRAREEKKLMRKTCSISEITVPKSMHTACVWYVRHRD